MAKIIDDFITFLDKNNFVVNTTDKLLIFKSIRYIDISEKNQFFALMYTILIKNFKSLNIFKELFDIFFETYDFKKDNITYDDKSNNNNNDSIVDSTLSSYKFNKYDYNSSIKYFILNDDKKLNRLIRLAISNIDNMTINNSGSNFNRVKNSLNIDNLEKDIEIFRKTLLDSGANLLEINIIIDKIINNLKNFKKKIRLELKDKQKEYSQKDNLYLDIDKIEYELLESIVKNIAEKLNKKKSKRYKYSNNGFININKTLHKSISYSQIPLKRIYKKRKYKKRNLIIFTDVSDSVKKYSQTILYFIYSLNKFFKDIKTFTFISDVENISFNFKSDISFDIFLNTIISKGGNSDYNSSFEVFFNKYNNYLNKNTIFIVIGDARNNYISAELKNLINIDKKVKEIIWLNPESKFLWNTADSNMLLYQKIVDKTYSIKTIKDIEVFSKEIIFK